MATSVWVPCALLVGASVDCSTSCSGSVIEALGAGEGALDADG